MGTILLSGCNLFEGTLFCNLACKKRNMRDQAKNDLNDFYISHSIYSKNAKFAFFKEFYVHSNHFVTEISMNLIKIQTINNVICIIFLNFVIQNCRVINLSHRSYKLFHHFKLKRSKVFHAWYTQNNEMVKETSLEYIDVFSV